MNKESIEELRAEFNARLDALIEQAEPRIDLTRLPVDTLIKVSNGLYLPMFNRRFKQMSGSRILTFYNGADSATLRGSIVPEVSWNVLRILENPPVFWRGGECPIPDGVPFMIWYRDGDNASDVSCSASNLRWNHTGSMGDIIAYQLLEMSEWLNAKGEVVS